MVDKAKRASVGQKTVLLCFEKESEKEFNRFFNEQFSGNVKLVSVRYPEEAIKYLMSHPVNLVLGDISTPQAWSNIFSFFNACRTLYPSIPIVSYYCSSVDPKHIVGRNLKYWKRVENDKVSDNFFIKKVEEIYFPIVSHLKSGFSTEVVNKQLADGTGDSYLRGGKALAYFRFDYAPEYIEKFIDGDSGRRALAKQELDRVLDYFEAHDMKSEYLALHLYIQNDLDLKKTEQYMADLRNQKDKK